MGQRINNWQIAFQKAINKDRVFKFGTLDCALFVLDCIKDYTNNKLFENYSGKYSDFRQALSILKSLGGKGKNFNECYISFLDVQFKRINKNFAQRGDIVGISSNALGENNKIDRDFSAGLMCDGFARFLTTKGYLDLPREKVSMAWKV